MQPFVMPNVAVIHTCPHITLEDLLIQNKITGRGRNFGLKAMIAPVYSVSALDKDCTKAKIEV